MSAITKQVTKALVILFAAIAVRAIAARFDTIPYTALLVVVGSVASVFGLGTKLSLSPDIILTLLLPAVLFWGAAETKSQDFRSLLPIGIVLAVVGLPATILLVGTVGEYAFDVPLIFTLLFAAIVSPIDPVSVQFCRRGSLFVTV